jgi:hypothetical protein
MRAFEAWWVRAGLLAHASRNGGARRAANLLFFGLISVNCTSLLGIDGDYVAGASGTSGGRGGTGGLPAASGGNETAGGGLVGDGGSATGGGTANGAATNGGSSGGGAGRTGAANGCADANGCSSGEKCCQVPTEGGVLGVCVAPTPAFGCTLDDCAPCSLPTNGVPVCANDQCDVECNFGYEKQAGECVLTGTGGAGGGGGGGGAGGRPACKPLCCSPCLIPYPNPTCCQTDGTCGCSFLYVLKCYPRTGP